MKKEQKIKFIKEFHNKDSVFTESEWNKVVKQYSINYTDVMNNKNSKYQYNGTDGKPKSVVYTISNGNAFDCPALKAGRCNMPCYGLKGTFSWNVTKINKTFQYLILKLVPLKWLFDAIKYHATSNRKNKENLLRFLRINEVSDFNSHLFNRILALSDMLYSDESTRHIMIFSYSKMNMDWDKVLKHPNLVVNASQTVNPLYDGGNTFIAVDEQYFNNIVESDTVKKCNCETNCHNCEYCYNNNGYTIFCLIH